MSDDASPSTEILRPAAGSGIPALARQRKMAAGLFIIALAFGIGYAGLNVFRDVIDSGTDTTTYMPFVLLVLALFIALGFEFVNGFHDTANAVATVIYTNSLPPTFAIVWSGFFNFLGVLLSSGLVAFGIIALLPVELILQAGSHRGFAMVFALLLAAIIWNLGTWWFGLPASSSHTLIGSIFGVGIANALIHGRSGTSGVDWDQAMAVGYALLLSPVVGFVCAALVLLALRRFFHNRELFDAPRGFTPPPWWIRTILVVGCTGVSFAHGSNDGQKGMGLIMLILVGTMPLAYALNRAIPDEHIPRVVALATVTQNDLMEKYALHREPPAHPRAVLSEYVATREITPEVIPAIAALIGAIAQELKEYGAVKKMPAASVANTRNDMYLTSEALKHLKASEHDSVVFDDESLTNIAALQREINNATRFIPSWVKVSVALALGLGTMVGWRRIVVTVGEKIGKTRLSYAQGASAQLVAMLTIGGADHFGLPVSTTHVLSSGVAGTMAANRSGLHTSTVRNLLMAWVLTFPMSVLLAGGLYWLFVSI